MANSTARRFLAPLLLASALSGAARLEAQDYNSVPLDHGAYSIIEIGIKRRIILPPPAAKPWALRVVRQKLWEMIEDPEQALSGRELEAVYDALASLDRKKGLELKDGRFWTGGDDYSFETGVGWESAFSVESPGGSIASVNALNIYAGGNVAERLSWNASAWGEFLYIDRSAYGIPAIFPHSFSRPWDGGVLSFGDPGAYAGWPDDPSLAYRLEAELNGGFFDSYLWLRLGRVRREWGAGLGGASLFLNSHARPFAALEGTFMPLSWLNVSFLGGALEHFREGDSPAHENPFSNGLSALKAELSLMNFIYFDFGAAAAFPNQADMAFFANLELRFSNLFTILGGLFADRLVSSAGNGNAFQAGIRTDIVWMPLAVFAFRYTRVEQNCYALFSHSGESLGYYLPSNSDEFFVRLESMFSYAIKAHVQFQLVRWGVDYGSGAVGSLAKSFLKDGVYQWDNIFKIGGTFNFKGSGAPLSIFAETGLAVTNFTINGDAGVGSEAEYEPYSDSVYQPATRFLFSVGFRLFP